MKAPYEWPPSATAFLSATLGPSGVSRVMAELFARADVGTRLTLMNHGVRQGGTLLRAMVGA